MNQTTEVHYSQWLQNGYRIREDATESIKYMECVYKNHTFNVYYNEKLRFGARTGVKV